MQKVYQRINWENEPSTKSPLNDDNLNKMDYALDQIDSRVVQLSGYEERVAQSEKNAKTSETNAKVSEINAKESEVKAKEYMEQAFKGTPEGYQEFLDKVDALEIKTTKDKTNKGTKHGGFRLTKMLANTEQKKLSGKNLLPIASTSAITQNGVTFTPIYDASGYLQYVNVNGTATDNAYIVISNDFTLNAGTYTLSGCPIGGSYSTYRMYVNGGNAPTDYGDGDTFTLNESFTYVNTVIYVTKGATVSNLKFYPMISKEGGEYEPFCGGMASPNSSYPQPLLSTGDCVEMIQGAYGYIGGAYDPNSTTYVCNKNPINCNGGDVLKIKYDTTATQIIIVFYNENGYLSNHLASAVTETVVNVPSGATYFNFDICDNRGLTPQTAGKITITINGKYLNCAKTHSKNLFNINGNVNMSGNSVIAGGFNIVNGNTLTSNLSTSVSEGYGQLFTNLKGKKVTFSARVLSVGDGVSANILFYDNRTLLDYAIGVNVGEYIKVTQTCQSDLVVLAFGTGGGTGGAQFTDIQVEIGDTATPFEPFGETVAYYLTQYPMIKGSTLYRENGLVKAEHTMKEKFYLGSEILDVLHSYNGVVFYKVLKPTDSKVYGAYSLDPNCLSDKFLLEDYANHNTFDSDVYVNKILTQPDNVHFWLGFAEGTTLEQARSIGNISVQYTLATPIIETLDTASQIALNGLGTFDGMTIVEFDTRVQPLEFEAEVGTSQMGAYTLKSLNNSESNAVKIEDAINTMLLITP